MLLVEVDHLGEEDLVGAGDAREVVAEALDQAGDDDRALHGEVAAVRLRRVPRGEDRAVGEIAGRRRRPRARRARRRRGPGWSCTPSTGCTTRRRGSAPPPAPRAPGCGGRRRPRSRPSRARRRSPPGGRSRRAYPACRARSPRRRRPQRIGLDAAPLAEAAGDVEDQLAQRDPRLALVDAGALDVAGDA